MKIVLQTSHFIFSHLVLSIFMSNSIVPFCFLSFFNRIFNLTTKAKIYSDEKYKSECSPTQCWGYFARTSKVYLLQVYAEADIAITLGTGIST